MRNMTAADRTRLRESLIGNLLLLLFGCGVLAFLVAADRVNWFSIRPATGTSIALARSTQTAKDPVAQRRFATTAQHSRSEFAVPQ